MSASNRESVAPANRDAALVDASLPPPDAGSPSSFSPPFPVFPPSEDELTAVKRQLDALQPKIDAAEKRRDELRAKGDPDWKLDNDEVKQLRTKEALLLKKEEQLRDELKRKEVQSEQTAAVAGQHTCVRVAPRPRLCVESVLRCSPCCLLDCRLAVRLVRSTCGDR